MEKKEYIDSLQEVIGKVCIGVGPNEWKHGKEVLVKVKLPEKVSELLKLIVNKMGKETANLATFESALINTLVYDGLVYKAMSDTVSKLMGKLEGEIEKEEADE